MSQTPPIPPRSAGILFPGQSCSFCAAWAVPGAWGPPGPRAGDESQHCSSATLQCPGLRASFPRHQPKATAPSFYPPSSLFPYNMTWCVASMCTDVRPDGKVSVFTNLKVSASHLAGAGKTHQPCRQTDVLLCVSLLLCNVSTILSFKGLLSPAFLLQGRCSRKMLPACNALI